MYSLDVATFLPSLHTFWGEVAMKLPNDVAIQAENAGDIISDATGDLVGAWTADAVGNDGGIDSNPYAAPSGAVVTWLTAQVLDGRRLRGRTFIVPLAGSKYQSDGSLDAATISVIQAAANQLISAQSSSFVIWHRPFAGSPAVGSRAARPAHDGGHAFVTSAVVHDFTAVLRSRRD
jgi:hypothetical protein